MEKVIITCAVTGAETTLQDNPNLPITPEEIAIAAGDAAKAGASILHLHVRDSDGNPTPSITTFEETIRLIQRKCDIVIEITTGGAAGMSFDERMAPLTLKPEMASLDCGTINFGDEFIVNTRPMIRRAAERMADLNITPTFECFDLSHVDTAIELIHDKLFKPPFYFSFILNLPGGLRYSNETLAFLAGRLPKSSFWTAIGIGGRVQLPLILGALSLGGFIRVGFEDNVYYDKGILAESNAQLVERGARIIKDMGKAVMSPDEVRTLFRLRR